jgi:hypothetical protein
VYLGNFEVLEANFLRDQFFFIFFLRTEIFFILNWTFLKIRQSRKAVHIWGVCVCWGEIYQPPVISNAAIQLCIL